MVKIIGSVGKNGRNKIEDVALTQAALSEIKGKTGKAYWAGSIDGKGLNSDFHKSIATFQKDHKFAVSSKISFNDRTALKIRQKTSKELKDAQGLPDELIIPSLGSKITNDARARIFQIEKNAPLPLIMNRPKTAQELQSILLGVGQTSPLVPVKDVEYAITIGGTFTAKIVFHAVVGYGGITHSEVKAAYLRLLGKRFRASQYWTGFSGTTIAMKKSLRALSGIGKPEELFIESYLKDRGVEAKPTHPIARKCVAALAKTGRKERLSLKEVSELLGVIKIAESSFYRKMRHLERDKAQCLVIKEATETTGGIELLSGELSEPLPVEIFAFAFVSAGFSDEGEPQFKLSKKGASATLSRDENGDVIIREIGIRAGIIGVNVDLYNDAVEFNLGPKPKFKFGENGLVTIKTHFSAATLRIIGRNQHACKN